MSNHLPVLIVGAGPTGLMMACELARHGIPFRIIDKKNQPTLSSNATWIQSRTLEVFEHMGIADRFVEIGNACQTINLYVEGKSLIKIPLKYVDSTYPFILMLPQSETENLLNQHLEKFNKKVERPVELIDVKQTNGKVVTTIRYSNNQTETVTSDWLIACDGANSTIREKCQIVFPGEDLTEQFIVADAEIDSSMAKNEAHVFFDKGTLFAAFPLASGNYRITANLHLDYPRKNFSEREVVEMTQERAQGAYYVKKASWISAFWVHSKTVNQMQHHSIFLVGDAAHIHSPMGGQGMNMGIQDAYNLAWKLALVIKEKAPASLLTSYQAERHPVIKNVVKLTEQYTKKVLFEKSFLKNLRSFANKMKQNQNRLAKKIGDQLTQLTIQYKNSPIIEYKKMIGKSVSPGTRAPDVIIDSLTRLYDFFRNTKHNILLFTGLNPTKKKMMKIMELKNSLNDLYPESVNVYIVSKEKMPDVRNTILDPKGLIHKYYHASDSIIYIIRPDNYIGFCSKKLDLNYVIRFFKKYLVK